MAIVVHNTLWENIPVADEIKPYIIHTVELRYMLEEEVEYQVFHRAQAQIFLFKAAGGRRWRQAPASGQDQIHILFSTTAMARSWTHD